MRGGVMARLKVEGIEGITDMLGKLADAGTKISKMAVYDGAKVVADEIRKEIAGLPVDTARRLRGGDKYSVITAQDKSDLSKSLGVRKMEHSLEETWTVVGIAGYGSRPTRKYRSGLPMPLLARALHKGTVVREKNAFATRAISRVRTQAKQAMITTAEREIGKIADETN